MMTRIVVAGLVAVAWACGGGAVAATDAPAAETAPTAPPAAPVVSPERHPLVLVYNELDAALAAQDTEVLERVLAADCELIPTNSGMSVKGADRVIAFFNGFAAGFPDMANDTYVVLARDRVLAVLARSRGTNSAASMGMPATNEKASFIGLSLLYFNDDNEVQKWVAYADNLNFFAQLGVYAGTHRPYDDSPARERADAVTMDTQTELANLTITRAVVDHFNTGDVASAVALYAPGAVMHDQGAPVDANGVEAIGKALTTYRTWFPDLRVEIDAAWAAGDYVVMTFDMRGTNKGAMPELGQGKPTGKSIDLAGAYLFYLMDGKILEHWVVFDRMAMMVQLGLWSGPGAP